MKTRLIGALALVLCLPGTLLCQSTTGPNVRFHTSQGDIDVTLLPGSAPKTVANFLNYVNRAAFNNSIFHRSVPNFIIQGGGYVLQNHVPVAIPSDPAVRNEYSVSNGRGTLAMAKTSDPNSATNQWFFNTVDNTTTLGPTNNAGYTVFGRVTNAAGLAIMDKIAKVPVYNAGSPFDQLPLTNYNGAAVQDSNFITVLSITQIDTPPAISSGGIVTASSFGRFSFASPGSFIEIYGSNLAGTTRGWADADFKDGAAPTALDEVTVTINGQAAYVAFVSPAQVNVQVPANVPTGGSVPVVVSYKGQPSPPVSLTIKPFAGGLLAPATFNVNGKQYVAAVHARNGAFVSGGNIPDTATAPAAPGETLVLYGIGFGAVTPTSTPIAGQIVQGLTALSTPVQFSIGQSPSQIVYAGFAPGLVGLYQFNITVPADAPNGDLPLEVVLGGETIPQTLYIPVHN